MSNNLYIKWQQSQPCNLDQLEAFIKENNLYDPSSKYNIPNKFKQLKIKYNCEVCGKENILKYKNYLDKGSRRLCTGCKLKDTWIEKYGSMENYAKKALEVREKTCEEKYGEGIRNPFQDP